MWRKRVRTVLTLLSVVAAFLLFGALHGVTAAIDGITGGLFSAVRAARLPVASALRAV